MVDSFSEEKLANVVPYGCQNFSQDCNVCMLFSYQNPFPPQVFINSHDSLEITFECTYLFVN